MRQTSKCYLRGILYSIAVVMCLAINACGTITHRPSIDPHSQTHYLQKVRHWQAEGKFALSYDGEKTSASFDWGQQNDQYLIHLYGPFGTGSTWVRRTKQGVSLENAETGLQQAHSAEHLMLSTLGWQVPVSELQYWMLGLPSPNSDYKITTNEFKVITQIRQQQWDVQYTQHQVVNGWTLPAKIKAQRGDIRITLVVKKWDLPAAPEFPL